MYFEVANIHQLEYEGRKKKGTTDKRQQDNRHAKSFKGRQN